MTRFSAPRAYRGRPPYLIGGRPPVGRVILGILVAAVAVAAGVIALTGDDQSVRVVERPPGQSVSMPRVVPSATSVRPADADDAVPPPAGGGLESQPDRPVVPLEEPETPQSNASSRDSPFLASPSIEDIGGQDSGRNWRWPAWNWRWGIPSLGLFLMLILGPGWFWILTSRRRIWTVTHDGRNPDEPRADNDLTTVLDRLAQGPRRDLAALVVATERGARTVGPLHARDAADLLQRRPATCEYASMEAAIDSIRRSYRGRHMTVEVARSQVDAGVVGPLPPGHVTVQLGARSML